MPRIGLVGSSKAGTRGFEDVSQIVEYWMDLTQQSHEEIEFVSGGVNPFPSATGNRPIEITFTKLV